uniref:Uncharacterized protein n=1 Tax=Branchiostoma floridae TaxID=7739 RepID=C3YY81_BRAFL|eukprot:XP_002598688.1 hypothetical protein BRAFLDRAFT_107182 [Branchiostoma floridae]
MLEKHVEIVVRAQETYEDMDVQSFVERPEVHLLARFISGQLQYSSKRGYSKHANCLPWHQNEEKRSFHIIRQKDTLVSNSCTGQPPLTSPPVTPAAAGLKGHDDKGHVKKLGQSCKGALHSHPLPCGTQNRIKRMIAKGKTKRRKDVEKKDDESTDDDRKKANLSTAVLRKIQHPLATEWSVWFIRQNITESWSERIQIINYSFRTIETFWETYNHLCIPSVLPKGSGTAS